MRVDERTSKGRGQVLISRPSEIFNKLQFDAMGCLEARKSKWALASAAVLNNNMVIGSMNANKRHWYKASEALARADRSWLGRLITWRERLENFTHALAWSAEDIKVIIQFSQV